MNIDLNAIQARADAATEGPWEIKTEDRETPSVWHDQEVAFSIGRCADCGVEAEYETADAEFISESRTDVPALLALVRSQQAQIERVREYAHGAPICQEGCTDLAAEILDTLTATDSA